MSSGAAIESCFGQEMTDEKLRTIVVQETLHLLANTPKPHTQSHKQYQALNEQFEELKVAVHLAYQATRVYHANAYGRREAGQTTFAPLWEVLVGREIDPRIARFRICVGTLAQDVVSNASTLHHAHIHNIMEAHGLYKCLGSQVISFLPPLAWAKAYTDAIQDHLWKVEAILWRHFSQWRLYRHIDEYQLSPRSMNNTS